MLNARKYWFVGLIFLGILLCGCIGGLFAMQFGSISTLRDDVADLKARLVSLERQGSRAEFASRCSGGGSISLLSGTV